jgi:hypothetical protein
LFEAVAQLLGGVNVVVTGPQFSKVNPDSVEALGILVVLEVMISMIAVCLGSSWCGVEVRLVE